MKKELLSLFLIWTVLFVSVGVCNTSAQTISKDTIKNLESTTGKLDSVDKKFGKSLNTYRKNVLDTPVDFDKITKESNKPLARRKMSKKQKAFWVLFAVGMAALVFVAIKYYKECEVEDPDCPIGETICPCLKYKDETP